MKCPICNDLRLPNLHVKRRMKDLPKKHAKIPTADQMYIDFAQLSESAKSGCLYCALLIDGVRRFFPNRIIYCMDLFWDGYCTITIQNPQDGEPYPHYLEFYRDDPILTETCFPFRPHVSEDSSGQECMISAASWLRQCTSSHLEQCGSGCPAKLPTRVIAVGRADENPYLYEPSPEEKGSYAALSYCWGKSHGFTTTMSNYPARKSGFMLSELPKTCRDAIAAARNLNIPYVWIDSLCIIQDSRSDWELESGSMCSVYENALVTFAALDSPDSDTGLFLKSPSRKTERLQLPKKDDDSKGANRYVYARIVYPSWRENTYRQQCPEFLDRRSDCVLYRRGWTLQEIALSHRVLFFGDPQLAWSCCDAIACERYPSMTTRPKTRPYMIPIHLKLGAQLQIQSDKRDITNDPPSSTWTSHIKPLFPRRKALVSKAPEVQTEDHVIRWMSLVSNFTERDLSNIEDRLPALSGLARRFTKELACRYYCGLLETSLLSQLLWYCSYDLPTQFAPVGGTAIEEEHTASEREDAASEEGDASSRMEGTGSKEEGTASVEEEDAPSEVEGHGTLSAGNAVKHPFVRFELERYAPSWSWASVPGHVTYDILDDDDAPSIQRLIHHWTLIRIAVSPRGKNRFGPSEGVLEIEGLVIPLVVKYDSPGSPYLSTLAGKLRISLDAGKYPFVEGARLDRRPRYYQHEPPQGNRLCCLVAGIHAKNYLPSQDLAGLLRKKVQLPLQEPWSFTGLLLERISEIHYARAGFLFRDFRSVVHEGQGTWEDWQRSGERKRVVII